MLNSIPRQTALISSSNRQTAGPLREKLLPLEEQTMNESKQEEIQPEPKIAHHQKILKGA